MTDNVVELSGLITKLDIPPTRILAKAAGAKLEKCFVIGETDEGDFYFASSIADGGTVLWLMEMAKKRLMEVDV